MTIPEHDNYVVECVKCIQFQESDKEYNREILKTGYLSPYMDYLLHAAYTGPRSTVGNVSGYRCMSDCRSRGREFDPGPVPYFRGD